MSDTIPAADVVEAYARPSLGAPAQWDEMVDPNQGVRETWREVGSVLRLLGPSGLAEQRRTVATMLAQDGVTYRPHGSEDDQPWALDPVPMLLDESEWTQLEPALVQRTELLDLILTDLYGPRRLLAEGLIPAEIVFGHEGFVRAVDQIRLPAARQLFLGAADLARGPDGQWIVIGDRTQAPSGTGYAMANRRVVSRALPGLYRDTRIHRIGPFFQAMRVALQALAPSGSEVPRIVLLTSGAGSETAFDQAFLSSLLGFPLVEGSDLVVRDGHVWQRSIGRLAPVDVILRRVDSWFCDPLELRPESQLGIPGLVEAMRLGTVSVVNGLGTGVLENPALYPLLPRLCEVLLGQPLRLPSVPTWWCGEATARQHVLANLASMVIKPVSRQVVNNSQFGWELTAAERDDLRRRIEADPGGWVGQDALRPSTAPGVGAGGLEARPMRLRSFAVADGGSYRMMPGGLSQVAAESSSVVVTTTHGALAKDVWVLSSSPDTAAELAPSDLVRGQVAAAVSPRVAETLFWLGRYAERAEDVSRLVAVTDNRWHDVHPGVDPAVPQCVEVLMRGVIEVTAPWPLLAVSDGDPYTVLRAIIGDAHRSGTLAHDIRRVRELANASRDQLSTDTWAVFRDLDRVLAPFAPAGTTRDVAASMSALRAALMAFAGLAAESMVRDSGWHFMDTGRRIERALQIARLLQSCLGAEYAPSVATLVEESTLIAAESIITHRRRYPAQSGVDTVLELLLVDRDNPRSMAFQLDRLAVDLRRISSGTAGEDPLSEQLLRISAHLLAVDCSALAESDSTGRRTALDGLLGQLIAELHQLAGAVEQAHFAHLGTLRPFVASA
ncbi:circularly permuted type 2 ATP-grasp protein [Jatrophihabitans sp.]|uniref:circularly permuted type 2 ATP-grasp protein n=1 Tax=Jatrophihabitans sp. TaxID=1932789 RepID=UPI0030C71BCA|nr:hypothetical protein [Jatrophihabitans sp.]